MDIKFELDSINSGKAYKIIGFEDSSSDELFLPSYCNGKPISEIGIDAFRCFKGYKVFISNTIEYIGAEAFRHLKNLKQVVFQEESRLKIIGYSAFASTGIVNLFIPKSVEIINFGVFSDCHLQNLTFEDGSNIKEIGEFAFSNSNFNSIDLSFNGAVIRFKAFANNPYLHSVNLRSSDNLRLEEDIFYNCSNLKSIIPPLYNFKYDAESFPSAEIIDSIKNASLFA